MIFVRPPNLDTPELSGISKLTMTDDKSKSCIYPKNIEIPTHRLLIQTPCPYVAGFQHNATCADIKDLIILLKHVLNSIGHRQCIWIENVDTLTMY